MIVQRVVLNSRPGMYLSVMNEQLLSLISTNEMEETQVFIRCQCGRKILALAGILEEIV